MPKMGESIMEATILKWLKKEGDTVAADEPVLEIATDKVDSEVPSPHAGTIVKLLFKEGDVVAVGKAIAIINTGEDIPLQPVAPVVKETMRTAPVAAAVNKTEISSTPVTASSGNGQGARATGRFYSPLVLNIARSEGISMAELENIPGTGKDNRVTKSDILNYIEKRSKTTAASVAVATNVSKSDTAIATDMPQPEAAAPEWSGNVEIIEMDRMRQIIAVNMVKSKHTAAHVTSFVEADVTNMVLWRDRVKKEFETRENEKITFTPLFIEALIKALKEFPRLNASVSGNKIIIKKDINIGMATALPNGNLIVPVIKNADYYNLVGLTKKVNDLASRARDNKLKPEDIEGGTFTISNVGTFGNLMGTPIINLPQVAILATGAIKKKPVVIETEQGDSIAIRHMMFLSLSYDHRIIDGALGGTFLRKVADYMEAFDPNRDLQ
jgi:2-oxoglutarate dehydrogenase E2 component (dihydrolipoamide succinyltransferase)